MGTNNPQNYCYTCLTASFEGCSGKFGFGGTVSETKVPTTGELAPPRTACSRAGGGYGRGSPLLLSWFGGVTPRKFFEIFDAKSRIWGHFGPENKLIEGQPNDKHLAYAIDVS